MPDTMETEAQGGGMAGEGDALIGWGRATVLNKDVEVVKGQDALILMEEAEATQMTEAEQDGQAVLVVVRGRNRDQEGGSQYVPTELFANLKCISWQHTGQHKNNSWNLLTPASQSQLHQQQQQQLNSDAQQNKFTVLIRMRAQPLRQYWLATKQAAQDLSQRKKKTIILPYSLKTSIALDSTPLHGSTID